MKQDDVHGSFFKRMFKKGEEKEWWKFLIFVLCIALLVSECMLGSFFSDGGFASAEEGAAGSSPDPSASASVEPSASESVAPSASASVEPSASASVDPSASASVEPSASASVDPSASASIEPSASASVDPSASASVAPSASASASPSASASVSPTPTSKPTATPSWTYNPNAPVNVATINPSMIPAPTPKTTVKPAATSKPSSTTTPSVMDSGEVKQVGNIKYSVISSNASGGTVSIKKTANKNSKTLTIPDKVTIQGVSYKVTSIGKRAFTGMKKLQSVTMGKNIEKIGESAFESCQKLEFVMIPKNVTKIGKRAFAACKKLHVFVIKSSKVSSIGSKAFLGTNGVVKIKVPKKKLMSYKKMITNGKISRYVIFLTSPKTITYKGNTY